LVLRRWLPLILVWLCCAVLYDKPFSNELGSPKKPDTYSYIEHAEFPPQYTASFLDSLSKLKRYAPACSLRTMEGKPFVKGETLVYTIDWGILNAGYAVLEARPDSATGLLTILGRGMTNGFFSTMYKVRDHYATIMDTSGMYPFFLEEHIREGGYKDDRWISFDQAHSVVFTPKKDADSVSAPFLVQNYFSIVYFLRSLAFWPNDSFTVDCFVDKKSYPVVFHCHERTTVKVDAGTFDCLLVSPVLVGKGRVFSKKDEIKMWMTDDEYKMPVMIKAKIAFGSMYVRLVWYSRKV
jgi:hypothetical protein